MNLIKNERVKLLATALNNIASATIVTGFVAPLVAVLYHMPAPAIGWFWILSAAVCVFSGFSLHMVAQSVLGRLEP